MSRLALPRYVVTGLVAILLALGCSNGRSTPTSPNTNEQPRDIAGGILFFGEFETSGDELIVPVLFRGANDLYAFSFRMGFDPSGLQPLRVEWGSIVEEQDSTFCMMDQPGFVPLAFSRFSIASGLSGDGTLCRMHFKILDPAFSAPSIITDQDFLVARNSIGEHLTLSVGGDPE
jgi:hypothetical protein